MPTRANQSSMHFKTMAQADVPQGRNGKHKQVVTTILNDLDQLEDGTAIKVPLAALPEKKENVRSALNRATRKAGRRVATATMRRTCTSGMQVSDGGGWCSAVEREKHCRDYSESFFKSSGISGNGGNSCEYPLSRFTATSARCVPSWMAILCGLPFEYPSHNETPA